MQISKEDHLKGRMGVAKKKSRELIRMLSSSTLGGDDIPQLK